VPEDVQSVNASLYEQTVKLALLKDRLAEVLEDVQSVNTSLYEQTVKLALLKDRLAEVLEDVQSVNTSHANKRVTLAPMNFESIRMYFDISVFIGMDEAFAGYQVIN